MVNRQQFTTLISSIVFSLVVAFAAPGYAAANPGNLGGDQCYGSCSTGGYCDICMDYCWQPSEGACTAYIDNNLPGYFESCSVDAVGTTAGDNCPVHEPNECDWDIDSYDNNVLCTYFEPE